VCLYSKEGFRVKNMWKIWKHALGSYSEQDGYDPTNDNVVGIIRTFMITINLLCAVLIMTNIVIGWL